MAAADYQYDPAEIEPRWQRVWADEGTWEVDNAEADDGADVLRARDAPLPERGAAHRASQGLLGR